MFECSRPQSHQAVMRVMPKTLSFSYLSHQMKINPREDSRSGLTYTAIIAHHSSVHHLPLRCSYIEIKVKHRPWTWHRDCDFKVIHVVIMWTRCSEWPMERYISRSNWECSAVNEEKEIYSGMELYWKGVVHHAHAVL